jgi:hypothetical protein
MVVLSLNVSNQASMLSTTRNGGNKANSWALSSMRQVCSNKEIKNHNKKNPGAPFLMTFLLSNGRIAMSLEIAPGLGFLSLSRALPTP